jgi:predicted dehydrogenase
MERHAGAIPSRKPIRFGVLGCSASAGRRILPALRGLAGARVVAVASRSRSRAELFATEFDCLGVGVDDLLDRADVDAVYLSVPSEERAEWAERVLRAGKHLLCGRPMTAGAADTRRLVELAAGQGLALRENMAFVHHPQHAEVAALVAGGRIGPVRAFHAEFRIPPPPPDERYDPDLGDGALLDVGVYPLRAAQLLLGPGVAVASVTLRDRGSEGDSTDRSDRAGAPSGGRVMLVARGGVLAHLEFGFESARHDRYSLWGPTARLTVERAFTTPPSWRPRVRIDEPGGAEQLDLAPADQCSLALAEFASAVRGEDPPNAPDSVAAMVETAQLLDAVRERAVRVPVRATAAP